MAICKKCVLNDNIFSVHIDEDGICNYCKKDNDSYRDNNTKEKLESYEKKFLDICQIHKNRAYQVVLAYSGGKDSTYTLYLLKQKYNLSVLTVTFNNGFLTEQSLRNIYNVTSSLDADNILIQPSLPSLAKVFNLSIEEDIFPLKALERASGICNMCIGLVKARLYQESFQRNIPIIAFGWTPGQVHYRSAVMQITGEMILANQELLKKSIISRLGLEYDRFFVSTDLANKHWTPTLVYPLLFNEYNEKKIVEVIQKIGWKTPNKVDGNSTNCQLNSYSNYVHMQKYKFNPYSLEIASLVRKGLMNREEGLAKINNIGSETDIKEVEELLTNIIKGRGR